MFSFINCINVCWYSVNWYWYLWLDGHVKEPNSRVASQLHKTCSPKNCLIMITGLRLIVSLMIQHVYYTYENVICGANVVHAQMWYMHRETAFLRQLFWTPWLVIKSTVNSFWKDIHLCWHHFLKVSLCIIWSSWHRNFMFCMRGIRSRLSIKGHTLKNANWASWTSI